VDILSAPDAKALVWRRSVVIVFPIAHLPAFEQAAAE
jgi:hypothetical protein